MPCDDNDTDIVPFRIEELKTKLLPSSSINYIEFIEHVKKINMIIVFSNEPLIDIFFYNIEIKNQFIIIILDKINIDISYFPKISLPS